MTSNSTTSRCFQPQDTLGAYTPVAMQPLPHETRRHANGAREVCLRRLRFLEVGAEIHVAESSAATFPCQ